MAIIARLYTSCHTAGGSKRRGPPDSRSARATNSSVPSNQPQNSTGPWLSRQCDPTTAQPSLPKQVASSHELHPTRCAVAAVNAYKLKSPVSITCWQSSTNIVKEIYCLMLWPLSACSLLYITWSITNLFMIRRHPPSGSVSVTKWTKRMGVGQRSALRRAPEKGTGFPNLSSYLFQTCI